MFKESKDIKTAILQAAGRRGYLHKASAEHLISRMEKLNEAELDCLLHTMKNKYFKRDFELEK